jgi:hypothetical protein
MALEGKVVHDCEDLSGPCKRDGVRWDEQQVLVFTRQRQGEPCLGPEPSHRNDHHVNPDA